MMLLGRSAKALTRVLVLALLLVGCGQPRGQVPAQTTTLAMGFIPNVQFTPFYVALEKGFFADEGIQIEFDYGWETDLLKLVGSDELQFAIASGDQVILARSQGLPVLYVMNWYRRFPVCLVSLTDAGIREPEDLVGRRVGTPALYGASYIGWRAFLDSVGLAEADVELLSIGYTQVAAVTQDQVDAAICYAMNEPVEMRAAGENVDTLLFADYVRLVSNGLITNERSRRERADLVDGMVRAALKGVAYTIEHPDESFELALKYLPEVAGSTTSETISRAILAESINFWRAEAGQLGRSELSSWASSLRIMEQMGLVETGGDVTAMFTNEFVEGATR